MELLNISAQSIATIASFVAPGFFALQVYGRVIPKVDRDFPRVLIESLAYSVLITGSYNGFIAHVFNAKTINATSIKYFLPLLAISILLGYVIGRGIDSKAFKRVAATLKLQGASDDFIDAQFRKVGKNELLTVTLKNGEIFKGVRAKISTYQKGEPQMCYFNYFSWYDKNNNEWVRRNGSLIFCLQDVQYIETARKIPDN